MQNYRIQVNDQEIQAQGSDALSALIEGLESLGIVSLDGLDIRVICL